MNDNEKDKKPVVGVKPLVTPPKTGQTPAPLPMWSGSVGDKLAGLPMFRGASQKPNSLLGRLKNLKTKDVAFIGAGLAVLVMAPLAEYLVSESSDDSGRLTQGFDQKGDFFTQGNGPSEMGINQLARGGLLGENPDIITPLNARDPSSLIMAAGGERQEPAPAAPAPEVKRDAPKDNVWDKVVSSAKSGATTAAKKVGLPKPNVKLSGALNGLRSLSGGSTGAKLALDKPDSKGLFSSPRRESHLAPTQAAPGYRGAGSRSPFSGTGGGHGGFDGRGAGPGGAGGATAGDVMGGGVAGGGSGTGGGRPGDGEATKSPGGSSTKDNKALGENLEFLRKKMEMEKAIDLKWAKKRYDELERKKMVEQTLVQTAQQAFLKVLDKLLEGKKDGGKDGGGGSPGGGSPSGGDPSKQPGNEADLPSGRPTAPPPAQRVPVGQSEAAVPASQELLAANKALGTQAGHLSSYKGTLDGYVKLINPQDEYGKQIHPPATAAQGKIGRAETAFSGAKGKLEGAKGQVDSANGKVGDANTRIEAKLKTYDGFKAGMGKVIGGFGEEGAPPTAKVEPSEMEAPYGQLAATKPQTETFEAARTFQNEGKTQQSEASDAIKEAPRDLSPEISSVQGIVTANPNCPGCAKALEILKDGQQTLTNTGQAADDAVRAAGHAIDRSNAATSASSMLDNLLERGKKLAEPMKTSTAEDYTKMKELEQSYKDAKAEYDKASDQTAKEAAKKKMDKAISDADQIRSGAKQREQKLDQWLQKRQQQLEEARKKLGK